MFLYNSAEYKIPLHLSKVEKETALLEFDESRYGAAAGLSPAGVILLGKKLEELVEEQDGRTEDQTWIMFLITHAKLGFYTCRKGWIHEKEKEGDDDVVEVLRKDGAGEDIRMGIYGVGLLRACVFSANAERLWIDAQNGLPILLSCPLCEGELGTLYFFSTSTPQVTFNLGRYHT